MVCRVLGEVRDPQVQQRRFAGALNALPDELILVPRNWRSTQRFASHRISLLATQSTMPCTRRATSTSWPNFDAGARSPIDTDVAAIKAAPRRSARQPEPHRKLDDAVDGEDPDLLHRARKAAKRARYAAELVAPLDPAAKKAGASTIKRFSRCLAIIRTPSWRWRAWRSAWRRPPEPTRVKTGSPTDCCTRANNGLPRTVANRPAGPTTPK